MYFALNINFIEKSYALHYKCFDIFFFFKKMSKLSTLKRVYNKDLRFRNDKFLGLK